MKRTQLTTGRVRLSFVHLFEPEAAFEGDRPRYSTTLLIPKTDKHTIGKLRAAIKAAEQNFRASNPGVKLPKEMKHTIHDGDGERPNGGPFGEECKGHYVMTASTYRKPVLVYADKTPITDPDELYSGCYARAVLNFYAYDTNGNRGISAGLNGVMKLSDGEPLAGGVVTDDDWDEDWNDDWEVDLPEDAGGGLLD